MVRLFSIVIVVLLAAPVGAVVGNHVSGHHKGIYGQRYDAKGNVLDRGDGQFSHEAPDGTAALRWRRSNALLGGDWRVIWARGGKVPAYIWGPGLYVSGANASPEIAYEATRDFLRAHLSLLAPESKADDFKVFTNTLNGGTRVVGYSQLRGDVPVLDGSISFRIKNDRIFVVASSAAVARRFVDAKPFVGPISPTVFTRTVSGKIASLTEEGRTWFPRKGEALLTRTFIVSMTEGGRYRFWIDVRKPVVVAWESLNSYGTSNVLYEVPDRHPGNGWVSLPAANVNWNEDGGGLETTDSNGNASYDGVSSSGEFLTRGLFARTLSAEPGTETQGNMSLVDGQTSEWLRDNDEFLDAQRSGYIYTERVKDYVRPFATDDGDLFMRTDVFVNEDASCNAYADGVAIHFLRSNVNCENTALLEDVIYHEYGHILHRYAIQDGVGRFDGALSEGAADFLSTLLTGDSGLGRGFRKNDAPLRELNTEDGENTWPTDVGEIHFTGIIFGGMMWDLWERLKSSRGDAAAELLMQRYLYEVLQRSRGVESTFVEILVADDDDGDLTNGTPNLCDINYAMMLHGLRPYRVDRTSLGGEEFVQGGHPLSISFVDYFPICSGDEIADLTVRHRIQGEEVIDERDFAAVGTGMFEGTVPSLSKPTTIQYQLVGISGHGIQQLLPANPAERWYEYFVGDTVPIFCSDLEQDPFENGWKSIAGWEWGTPEALPESLSTDRAFSGSHILGTGIGSDYPANSELVLRMPPIDLGQYSDVRLQFWRWLQVEDAFFDQAQIRVDGEVVWENFNSDRGNSSSIHHRDRNWLFQDVSLSPYAIGDNVIVEFVLKSDGGLEFDGWNIDSVCIVADPVSICGDGVLSGAEECDEGDDNNDESWDSCRSNCRLAFCGDGTIDTGEACDDGNNINDDECSNQCVAKSDEERDLGCESVETTSGTFVLLMLLSTVALRRRKKGSVLALPFGNN